MEASIKETTNRPADWESDVTAEVNTRPQSTPRKEIAHFAGQTLAVEAAMELAIEASQEGMGA